MGVGLLPQTRHWKAAFILREARPPPPRQKLSRRALLGGWQHSLEADQRAATVFVRESLLWLSGSTCVLWWICGRGRTRTTLGLNLCQIKRACDWINPVLRSMFVWNEMWNLQECVPSPASTGQRRFERRYHITLPVPAFPQPVPAFPSGHPKACGIAGRFTL